MLSDCQRRCYQALHDGGLTPHHQIYRQARMTCDRACEEPTWRSDIQQARRAQRNRVPQNQYIPRFRNYFFEPPEWMWGIFGHSLLGLTDDQIRSRIMFFRDEYEQIMRERQLATRGLH